tara:strand:+ start:2289 stop:3275 length:987 start_codon:yes stop_codon:yes gene_type:complete
MTQQTAGTTPQVATAPNGLAIAVLIPCYNEETAIGKVVEGFHKALPTSTIYVYDNNSSDRTSEVAAQAGAIVRLETYQGKGNVVRRMFADIDADIYVLVDGDNTYEADAASRLIQGLLDGPLDMVTGARIPADHILHRPGHKFGNKLFTGLVAMIFGRQTSDILSGYRVFSRRFVKSFPALSRGFEIETELTVHALEMRLPIQDMDTAYDDRLPGSESKLSTFKDGFKIMKMIFNLIKEERPLQFFGTIALVAFVISLLLGMPIISEFLATGLVPRFPTAILSLGIMIIAVLSLFSGLILDTVTLARREAKRLIYLQVPVTRHGTDNI